MSELDDLFGRHVPITRITKDGKKTSKVEYRANQLWALHDDGEFAMTNWIPEQRRFNGFSKTERPKVYNILTPTQTGQSEIDYAVTLDSEANNANGN